MGHEGLLLVNTFMFPSGCREGKRLNEKTLKGLNEKDQKNVLEIRDT